MRVARWLREGLVKKRKKNADTIYRVEGFMMAEIQKNATQTARPLTFLKGHQFWVGLICGLISNLYSKDFGGGEILRSQ